MANRLIHQPANPEFDVPVIQRRRRWILFGVLSGCCALVSLLGYTQTNHFGQGILRNWISKATDVSASAVSFRFVGLSRIVGRDIAVVRDDDVLFRCKSLDLKVDLLAWLNGQIAFDRVHVFGGEIEIVERQDRDEQWASLFARLANRKVSSKAILKGVALRDVRVEDTTIRFRWEEWSEAEIEISAMNLRTEAFSPNELGSVSLSAGLLMASDQANAVSGSVSGEVSLNLLESGVPAVAEGGLELKFSKGSGRLSGLSGRSGEIFLAIKPGQIEASGFRWAQEMPDLGSFEVQGPFDCRRLEGRLDVQMTPFRQPLLNLIGLVPGWEFGETEIWAETAIDWKLGGSLVSIRGHLQGNRVELQRGAAVMPQTELTGDYSFQLNRADGTLLMQRGEFSASSEGQQWLLARLESPVFLRWGGGRPGIMEPKITLEVTDLDLQAWAAFLHRELPVTKISLRADSMVKGDGKMILSDVAGSLDGVIVPGVNGTDLALRTEFTFASRLEEMKRFSIVDLNYEWLEDDRSVLTGDGVFSYQFPDQSYSFQLVSRGGISWFAQQSKWEHLELSDGDLEGTLRIQSKGENQDVVLSLSADGLEGRVSQFRLDDCRISVELDATRSDDNFLLNKFSLEGGRGYSAAGSVGFNGAFDSKSGNGNLRFRSVGSNRYLWGDLVSPYFDPEQLGEASLKFGGEIGLEAGKVERVEADIRVEQLVATNRISGDIMPLDFRAQAEATIEGNQVQVRRGRLELAETERSKNVVQFELNSPVTQRWNVPGQLTVQSAGLDLSDYWAWAQGILSDRASPSANIGLNVAEERDEPDSSKHRNWKVDFELDELSLRDLVVSNVTAQTTLGTGLVSIESVQASLGDGTLTGNWASNRNPDWTDYSIDLRAADLPVAEVVRAFETEGATEPVLTGELSGRLTLDGRLAMSDEADTNLEGFWEASVRYPSFPLANDSELLWLRPLLHSLRLPNLNSLVANRLYGRARFTGEIMNLEALDLDFESLRLRSQGQVALLHEIGQTPLNLPLEISLQRELTETAGMVLEPSPSDPAFRLLPQLAQLRGTLGDVELDWDEVAVAAFLGSIQNPRNGSAPSDQKNAVE